MKTQNLYLLKEMAKLLKDSKRLLQNLGTYYNYIITQYKYKNIDEIDEHNKLESLVCGINLPIVVTSTTSVELTAITTKYEKEHVCRVILYHRRTVSFNSYYLLKMVKLWKDSNGLVWEMICYHIVHIFN